MENGYSENQIANDRYRFLKSDEAKTVFGKVDFMLKSGTHVQFRHPEQESEFRFINSNFESLDHYYSDFFNVRLEKGGEETDTYYYLDFEGNKRGEIPAEQRKFLSEESLVIGIFACKVYEIDFNAEESSLTTFKKLMREEYEEYKDDFYRLLAQTKSNYTTGDDDNELEKSIRSAFRDFKKLGWVHFKNEEQFVIMPSLERLRKLYADEINGIEQLTQNYKPNK